MSNLELPEFYIALGLANEPKERLNQEGLRLLNLLTIDFVLKRLKPIYPKLASLDIQFSSTQWGTNKPDPRFEVYCEAQATACFSDYKNVPKDEEFLASILSTFDRDYLLEIARAASPSLATAVEVEARRLKRPTAGGKVKVPAWYMAFVCSEAPRRNPNEHETETLLQNAHKEATAQLKQVYPEDFLMVKLKIIRTEINENAGKPEDKFNLYVEFEAVVEFVQNTPTPMEVFRVLTNCTSSNFLLGLHSIGGPFATIVQMVIRLCVWIEIPVLVPADGPPSDGEPLIVKVHIEFFIALVVRNLSKMPTQSSLDVFDKLMVDFFSASLSAYYPGSFIDMVLEPNPKFEAGLPLPRFNMLHQYQATLQFYDPVPEPSQILCKILQCNVGALFDKICQSPAPWNDTIEVTLGKAAQAPVADKTYGGRLELPREEKLEVKPKPVVPVPKSKASAKARAQKKIEKKEVVERKSTIEAPVLAPMTPKKVEPKAKTNTSVGTSDVFVAFTLQNCDALGPSNADFKELADATRAFYASHLKKVYGDAFDSITVSVRKSLFNTAKPDPRYNVYVEWDIAAKFVVVAATTAPEIPDRYKLCRSLVNADCMAYLTKYVRGSSLAHTPFSQAVGVFTEQVNS